MFTSLHSTRGTSRGFVPSQGGMCLGGTNRKYLGKVVKRNHPSPAQKLGPNESLGTSSRSANYNICWNEVAKMLEISPWEKGSQN